MVKLLSQVLLMFFLVIILSVFLFSSPALTVLAQTDPCQQNTRNEGLISALDLASNTYFGNFGQACVYDANAFYREFKVPTYKELEDEFYYGSKYTYKKSPNSLVTTGGNLQFATAPADGLYLQTSSIDVNTVTGSGTQVIFINGNLNIKGNINYGAGSDTSGLVFVVSGDINISQSVTTINAVLIAEGIICTASNFGTTPPTCLSGTSITPALTVNGSIISINKTNFTLPGQKAIYFRRNLDVANLTTPAEEILKQAKYLYLLRGGLFTKDLVITQENKHFDIVATTTPPSPIPSPSPLPSSSPIPGLIAHWKMDEEQGTTIIDSVGTNQGISTFEGIITGRYGYARNFGGSAKISIPDSGTFQSAQYFTVTAWVYPRNWTSNTAASIFDRRNSSNQGSIVMQLNSAQANGNINCHVGVTNGGTSTYYVLATSTIPMTLNRWNMIACTYDGTNVKAYVNNNSPVQTTGAGVAANPANQSIRIGSSIGNNQTFLGAIDDVRFYNAALSQTQILQLYNTLPSPAGRTFANPLKVPPTAKIYDYVIIP